MFSVDVFARKRYHACRTARHEPTPETWQEMWQETYLSAILRAILYSDDSAYWLEAYRRLEPISTSEAEVRFLQAAEALFMKGASLVLAASPSAMSDPDQVGKLDQIQKFKLPLSSQTISPLAL